MNCPACGCENPDGAKFCNQCARPLPLRCLKCGTSNPAESRFCNGCAAPLPAGSTRLSTRTNEPGIQVNPEQSDSSSAPDGERKRVTALFADIKGSTELMRDLDPEEARAIIDPALKLMIDAVHRYDGYVVQSTGDGIFALFGAPVAHEDHPQRALRAALVARDELRRRGEDLRKQGRPGVEVRIGINTGEVVMRTVQTGGHTEYSPVGHVINLASRMQSTAPADGIVVSADTRHLVEGYFELRALSPTEVKGIARPIDVYEVISIGASHGHFDIAVRRGLTRFVGRARELEQMRHALDLAMCGHGQVVAVMAEAGTGKSRLFYEFKATIPTPCKVLEAYSVADGKASAWLPVLELLRDYFGIADADDTATRREKVRAALDVLDPALQDTLPYLFGLLGIVEGPDQLAQMDSNIKQRRTLDAIKRVVLRESLNQPLVIIFEDLHWIDGQTQSLLDLMADSVANSRVLLLCNYRPDYRHEWTNKSYYLQVRLDPLGGTEGAAMLSALLGGSVELDPLKRLIAERTGGNPFFIEEIVKGLFDEGALERNGAVKVAGPLSLLRLPATVQGILASRIDRQPSEQKQLLQTLAVLGKESPLDLIRQVLSIREPQLDRALADLRAAEFIYEQPTAAGVQYTFKHALTQEVAYNSVLIERRKLIHERSAQAIETLFASNLADHYSELAYHYSRSTKTGKAIEYLYLAGQQAAQRSASIEAVTYLDAALKLVLTQSDTPQRTTQELALQIALGPPLQVTKGWADPGVEQAYSRAVEACQQLGDSPQLFSALFGLQAFYPHRAKLRTARELAEQGLNLAQKAQDPALLLEACHMLAYNLLYLGELTLAREHSERGIALYHPRYHPLSLLYGGDDPGVCCLSHRALALWALGYPDQALESAHDALSLAQRLSHPLSLVLALVFAAVVHQLRREMKPACERVATAMALAAAHGFPYFFSWGMILQGWALTEQGQVEGIEQIRVGLAAYQATGAESFRLYHLALLADGHKAVGRTDEGLIAIAEALRWTDNNDERFYEPELYRLKGTFTLHCQSNVGRASGNPLANRGGSGMPIPRLSTRNLQSEAEAEACFWKAIDIARQQRAKAWELRATTSLALLLTHQGHRDEACSILADTYNWFTEGFDTADLKEAKALIDDLSR